MNQEGTTNKWTVVPPTVTYSPNSAYSVYSTAPNSIISLTISQWQSKSFSTTVTVVGKSSLPSWIAFDGSSTITIKPSLITQASDLGTYTVQVLTQTSMYYPAVTTITIPLILKNDPPNIIGTISNLNLYMGQKAYFQVPVSDTENDAITVSLSITTGTIPTAISSVYDPSAKTYTFSWSPTSNDVGVYNFVLSLSDFYNTATPRTFSFSVTVNKNTAPSFVSTPPTISIKEWLYTSYTLPSSKDNEGDPITIKSTAYSNGTVYPTWIVFDKANLMFKISPPQGAGGSGTTTYSLNVVLADPYSENNVAITLNVIMNNLPTVTTISSPINLTVPEQKSLQFQIQDSDSPTSSISVGYWINYF